MVKFKDVLEFTESEILEYRWKRMKAWGGVKRYPGTKITITATVNPKTGRYNTGLSEDKRKELEEQLGTDLRANVSNDFWKTFSISLTQNANDSNDEIAKTVDLTDPMGQLEFFVMSVHPLIATTDEDLKTNPNVIIKAHDPEREARVSNIARKIKASAYKIFDSLSFKEKKDMLTALGKASRTKNASNEIIDQMLGDYIDGGKSNQEKFVSLYNDPNKKIKTLINELVHARIVRKSGPSYYYGEDPIGSTLQDAVAFLTNSKNSGVRKVLTDLLKNHNDS